MHKVILTFVVMLLVSNGILLGADKAQIQASLLLEPDQTLPGIPVALRLVVRNLSSAPVLLPKAVALKVAPEHAEPFLALWASTHKFGWIQDQELRTIPARESKEIVFAIDVGLASPEWFSDRRLSWPGIYRLQIILEPNPDLSDYDLIETRKEPKVFAETIVSSEAVVTIEEPQGEDALVWQRLLKISKGQGWGASDWSVYGFQLAREIWLEHRISSYAPYTAMMVPASSWDQQVAIDEEVLARYPSHVMAPSWHSALANLFEEEMFYKLNVQEDIVGARKDFDNRQEQLRAVLQKSKNPQLRKQAEDKLNGSWEGIIHAHEQLKKATKAQQ